MGRELVGGMKSGYRWLATIHPLHGGILGSMDGDGPSTDVRDFGSMAGDKNDASWLVRCVITETKSS